MICGTYYDFSRSTNHVSCQTYVQEDRKGMELVTWQGTQKSMSKDMQQTEFLCSCRTLSCFAIYGGDGLVTADVVTVGLVVNFPALSKIYEIISL